MALPRIEVEVTADTRQAEAGLDRVGNAAIQASGQAKVAAGGMARLGRTFQNNGFAISNAANQFSDLAVQIGMGVPATRALSQQLPQLTAFMGPVVNVIGVASGVLIGLAGNFFMAGENAKTFQDDLDELEKSTKGLRDELFLLQQGLDNLSQVAVLREIQTLQEEIAVNEGRIKRIIEGGAVVRDGVLENLQELLAADKARLAELQKQLKTNQDLEQSVEAAKEAAKELSEITFGNIEAGVSSAQMLAKSMSISLEAAQRLMAITGGTSGVDPTVSGFETLDPRSGSRESALNRGSVAGNRNTSIFGPIGVSSSGGGGGGGGGGSPVIPPEDELTSEEERIKAHVERVKALVEGGLSDQLGAQGDYFSNMVSMVGTNNKRLLSIAKAFQSAQALVDSYQAYTQVLSDKSLPWFAKIPAAASVLAAGFGMVNAIKGVSEGGGSAGAVSAGGGSIPASSGAGGGAVAQGGGQELQRVIDVQLVGDNFSGAQIVGLINMAVEEGAVLRGVTT